MRLVSIWDYRFRTDEEVIWSEIKYTGSASMLIANCCRLPVILFSDYINYYQHCEVRSAILYL